VVARVRRDRLDWILAGSGTGIGAVERFKAFTAAAAHASDTVGSCGGAHSSA
jgi:hypothetical protein